MRIVDIPTGRPYQALIGRGLLDSLGVAPENILYDNFESTH